jgi:hypothetical protein
MDRMAASRALADQVARGTGERHVVHLARSREDGLPTGNAKNLAGLTRVPFGSPTPLQKIAQRLPRYQVWPAVVTIRQPRLAPPAHRAPINPKTTRRFVGGVATMNLDQPRIDLPPPARFHGCAGMDAGLGLPPRLAATRPAIHAPTSASSHPTALADNWMEDGKLPVAIRR